MIGRMLLGLLPCFNDPTCCPFSSCCAGHDRSCSISWRRERFRRAPSCSSRVFHETEVESDDVVAVTAAGVARRRAVRRIAKTEQEPGEIPAGAPVHRDFSEIVVPYGKGIGHHMIA